MHKYSYILVNTNTCTITELYTCFLKFKYLSRTWTYGCSYYETFSVVLSQGQNVEYTLHVEKGTTATFACGTVATHPAWSGPPEKENNVSTYYNLEGRSNFFTKLPNYGRLSWGSNNKNLELSDVVVADEGSYKCSASGQGMWTTQLNVRGELTNLNNVVGTVVTNDLHRPRSLAFCYIAIFNFTQYRITTEIAEIYENLFNSCTICVRRLINSFKK